MDLTRIKSLMAWSADHKSRRWLVLAAVVAVALAVFWYVSRPTPVAVVVWAVESGVVEATVANTRAGTVKACRRARLAPATGGQVAGLAVREGDRVRGGEVLLEIWNEDLAAQVRLAESEAKVSQARAEEVCLDAELAARDARRIAQLQQKKLVSEQAADRAVTAAKARAAGCSAARAATEESTARMAVSRATVARTILKAPFEGVVAEINGELGEFITPSPPGIPTPPAVDLIDGSCLFVSAPIDEVDAPAIRVGMPAYVTLDAFSGKRFDGKVRRVAPYVLDVEKQARTLEVEVELDAGAAPANLLPGYSADIEVRLESRAGILRVPTEAVLEGKRVLIYNPDREVLEERKIETGLSNWQYTEVSAGLNAGEQIVVSLEREGVKAGAHVAVESRRTEGANRR